MEDKETILKNRKCPKGHELAPTSDYGKKYPFGKYRCNFCKKIFQCSVKRLSCKNDACTYDVCRSCVINFSKKCLYNHKLEFKPEFYLTCYICKVKYDEKLLKCENCEDVFICDNCRLKLKKVEGQRVCPKDESHKSFTLIGCYFCDNKKLSNEWFCKPCNFFICEACVIRTSRKCHEGHTLKTIEPRTGEDYRCCLCNKEGKNYLRRYYCEKCKKYFCKYCIGVDYKRPKGRIGEADKNYQCCEGYKLRWTTEDIKESPAFKCIGCKVSFEPYCGRWHCEKCKRDVCGNCTTGLKCAQEHYMYFIKDIHKAERETSSPLLYCDGCETEQEYTDGVWNCNFCDFDLCTDCTHKKAAIDKNSWYAQKVAKPIEK